MMNPSAMRNLTLASAKHLVSQGHITKAHHAKIQKAMKAPMPAAMSPGPPMPPAMPPMGAAGPVGGGMGMPPDGAPGVPMGALDAQQP